MPSQQPSRNVPLALSPFQNVDTAGMFSSGGSSTNSTIPPVTLPQPISAPKLNHPGVIGDRSITRHNSVTSTVGSNFYDMMLRNSNTGSILGDPRVSCSPPLPGIHSSNGGTSVLGRPTCDSSTQTEENLGFENSVIFHMRDDIHFSLDPN